VAAHITNAWTEGVYAGSEHEAIPLETVESSRWPTVYDVLTTGRLYKQGLADQIGGFDELRLHEGRHRPHAGRSV